MVSKTRDVAAARRFFTGAIRDHGRPRQVTTDLAAPLLGIDELLPEAEHETGKHANNRVECDHGRLKARLRPMRGLKTDKTAAVVIRGHALVQNLTRGHYELGSEARHPILRLPVAFDEVALAVRP